MPDTDHVTIFEVGPRDGLQNEKRLIKTADKVKLVDLLSDSGLKKIEVSSFVSPKWVPQLADAHDVFAQITRRDGVVYAALTPNLRGFDGALQAKADEIAIFASASEGFSQKNINCSIEESFARFAPMAEAAAAHKIPMRGYVSCVTDCPYDGPTSPAQVARVAAKLLDIGCYEISLGETIGHGCPETVAAMLDAVLAKIPAEKLAGHFHDTGGRALDNIKTSLNKGIRVFDSAVAGLGGCPYAPGAKGNVATQKVVQMLAELGYETDIDQTRLATASQFAQTLRG